MIRRYLAGIYSVLRIIPAQIVLTSGALCITLTAIAMPHISPLGSFLMMYGGYRSVRRYRALNSFMPWTPSEVQR